MAMMFTTSCTAPLAAWTADATSSSMAGLPDSEPWLFWNLAKDLSTSLESAVMEGPFLRM
eukprot:9660574-Lingulodinium_polyedra.AAC.1